MRRCVSTALLALMFGLLIMGSAAAQPEIPGYVVSDLQLISQESKTGWSVAWSGPIQAATILAWYAEHGFPAFVRDYNNDGVIDELDTIELASVLGRTFMGTESAGGTTDVRLVLGLARYVAQYYPDRFVLKIYDAGFEQEFMAEGAGVFAADVVGGIELVAKSDPTIGWYEAELSSGEGVILGLEQKEANTYLSGRSYLYERTPAGETPIDLAWAAEDRWKEGIQGQVFETAGKMDELFVLDFAGDWTAVEFMLALSPRTDPPGTTDPGPCAEDAVAYDVNVTSLGDHGSIQVEECVTREGTVDTYTYTVTNIDFLYEGCGVCMFAVPKPLALGTLGHSEAVPWLYSLYPGAWAWRLPAGSCGLLPGDSAEFSVSVPGPTTDTAVVGGIATCVTIAPDGSVSLARKYAIDTTGPGEGCPDLIVRITDQACQCDPIDGICSLTVWAEVVNVGTAPATDAFEVVLRSLDHPANIGESYTPPPSLAPGGAWPVKLTISFPMGPPLCPTGFEVYVDAPFVPDGFVKECDETNNSAQGSADCFCEERGACCLPDGSCAEVVEAACQEQGGVYYPGVNCSGAQCAPPEEKCPDLTVQITELSCRNIGAVAPYYELSIKVEVTNVGTMKVTESIWTRVQTPCGVVGKVILTDLDPGDTVTESFTLNCTATQGGCHDAKAVVDYAFLIDECDEDNNEDTETFCCQ